MTHLYLFGQRQLFCPMQIVRACNSNTPAGSLRGQSSMSPSMEAGVAGSTVEPVTPLVSLNLHSQPNTGKAQHDHG
jgi:hypothetical protein